jgi:hypothetical protein
MSSYEYKRKRQDTETINDTKLIRVIQRNKYSLSCNLPIDACRILNINRHDILSCKLNKNMIVLQKVNVG